MIIVHCNHFFLMPIAQRLARAGRLNGKAPILLDTHDLQARQFALDQCAHALAIAARDL